MTEQIAPGQTVNRGDKGKFAPGGTLSRERAQEIGQSGNAGIEEKRSKRAQRLAEHLKLAAEGDAAAAQHVKYALYDRLADIAQKGGAEGLKAVEAIASVINESFKTITPPLPGERCRVCSRLDQPAQIVIVIKPEVDAGVRRLFPEAVEAEQGEIA